MKGWNCDAHYEYCILTNIKRLEMILNITCKEKLKIIDSFDICKCIHTNLSDIKSKYNFLLSISLNIDDIIVQDTKGADKVTNCMTFIYYTLVGCFSCNNIVLLLLFFKLVF
jgi:hypothetical protein